MKKDTNKPCNCREVFQGLPLSILIFLQFVGWVKIEFLIGRPVGADALLLNV